MTGALAGLRSMLMLMLIVDAGQIFGVKMNTIWSETL